MTAQKTRTAFQQSTAIRCLIRAPTARVWALLTDAGRFPSWNSTVTRLDGEIRLGGRLAIQVPVAPKRTFRPRVTAFEAPRRMVWSEGNPMFRGVRTFTVAPTLDGATEFEMTEVLSGLMLPMIRGSLPDFGPAFETYAADLKRAAEA
jgi:uncharacterized protein YndB with AHSA1/START domain